MSKKKKIIFWIIGIIIILIIIFIAYYLLKSFVICSTAKDRFEDFNFTNNPEYSSCSQDSDCIIEGCKCLNNKGISKFNFWSKFCGIFFDCEPPSNCTCENNQCQAYYDYGSEIKGEGVVLVTDKTEYEKGEDVKVTIKNNLDKEIEFYGVGLEKFFEYAASPSLEWDLFDVDIICSCFEDCGASVINLDSRKSEQYIWKQEKDNACEQVDSGKYRFIVYWTDYAPDNSEVIEIAPPLSISYSNEFRIK